VFREDSLEALALRFSEREVLCSPDDQDRPIRKLWEISWDLPEVRGRGYELPRGDHGRRAPGRISPGSEVHLNNLRPSPLREATHKEELRYKVERAREQASDGPAHHPAEDTNAPFPIERPRKGIGDNQAAHGLRPPTSEAKTDGPAPILYHHREVLCRIRFITDSLILCRIELIRGQRRSGLFVYLELPASCSHRS
jgi:hypothetical protein